MAALWTGALCAPAAMPLPYDDVTPAPPLAAEFAQEIPRALRPPPEAVNAYVQAMQQALDAAGLSLTQVSSSPW
jgi:hypothetical protein